MTPSSSLPELSGFKLLYYIPKLLRQRTQVFMTLQKRYGDSLKLKVHNPRHLFFHPDAVRRILKDNQKNYVKGKGYQELHPFFGEGLITSEGELWQKQRRFFAPEFHAQNLQKYFLVFQNETEAMLKSWEKNTISEYNISEEMMALTLKMVGSTLLGSDVSDDVRQIGEAVNLALYEIVQRSIGVFNFPRWFPSLSQLRIRRSMKKLNHIIASIIQKRRSEAENKSDLISKVLSLKNPEDAILQSDAQLRDQVVTFLVAGHETTANVLSWTFYLLSQHPEVLEKLLEEIDQNLGNRPLQFEDISKFIYLKNVLQESMRLYPPIPSIPRISIEEDEICGFKIPSATWIVLSPYVTHRHPDFWPQPERFNPERFESDQIAQQDPYAYFPFSAGPRKCIGEQFAMLESQVVIIGVLQKYRLHLLQSEKIEEEVLVTLKPKNGLKMKVQKRKN